MPSPIGPHDTVAVNTRSLVSGLRGLALLAALGADGTESGLHALADRIENMHHEQHCFQVGQAARGLNSARGHDAPHNERTLMHLDPFFDEPAPQQVHYATCTPRSNRFDARPCKTARARRIRAARRAVRYARRASR